MLEQRQAYSYQQDANVPDFEGGEVFTVIDAQCSLCARGATWIARHDGLNEFTFIPIQSAVGRALLIHYGLDPDDPTTWLYVEEGTAYSSLDAFIRANVRLGGVWRVVQVLRILPKPARDFLYRFVARNRFRFFGSTDLCTLPDLEVQKRLLK